MTSISKLISKQFDVTHQAYAPSPEKWHYIIDMVGYDKLKRCIPFTLDEIKKALPKDKHLNNLPIRQWDRACGFMSNGKELITTLFTYCMHDAGITAYSNADCVCILKEVARLWANE